MVRCSNQPTAKHSTFFNSTRTTDNHSWMLQLAQHNSAQLYTVATDTTRILTVEALRQCLPPPRHVLPYPDPDSWSGSPPKFNLFSLTHFQPSLKISYKSVLKFFCAKLLTDRQTNGQTDKKQQRLHILLGGGSLYIIYTYLPHHDTTSLDTYLIVPASNVDTRTAELKNITDWATINNLSLNFSKSEEIVFIYKRRKSNYQTPETLNGLKRIQHIKILGITFKLIPTVYQSLCIFSS